MSDKAEHMEQRIRSAVMAELKDLSDPEVVEAAAVLTELLGRDMTKMLADERGKAVVRALTYMTEADLVDETGVAPSKIRKLRERGQHANKTAAQADPEA